MARTDFGMRQLTLEGDFNQHVRVYAPAGHEQPTLEYLTPDVMAIIEDRIKGIVIFSDNYLTVSMPDSAALMNNIQNPSSSIQTIQLMVNDIKILLPEVRQKPAAEH